MCIRDRLKTVPFEQYGYQKADWDRIQAIK